MVAEQLGLGNIESHPFAKPPEGMWEIPYNKDGEYDPNCKMTLDLRIVCFFSFIYFYLYIIK